jgi:hypothetical protein
MTGDPLYYYAFAAQKTVDIPNRWREEVEETVA